MVEAPRQQAKTSATGKAEAREIERKRPLPPAPTTARKKGAGNIKRKEEVRADYDFGSDTDEAVRLIKLGSEQLRLRDVSKLSCTGTRAQIPTPEEQAMKAAPGTGHHGAGGRGEQVLN